MQVDPMKLIQQIKNGQNPQQLILSILENQMGNTPMGANLINLARNNQTAEIEKIVRNITQQRGLDFDKEFNAFKRQFFGFK